MQNKGTKIINALNRVEEGILVVILGIMVILTFAQVVSRYVFNNSLTWTEELSRYLFVWMSWVGVSLAAKEGQHICIDAVVNKFTGKKMFVVINILAQVIMIGICGIIVKEGVVLVQKMGAIHSVSPVLDIPMGICYLSVVVGCGLLILRSVGSIVVWVRKARAGIFED